MDLLRFNKLHVIAKELLEKSLSSMSEDQNIEAKSSDSSSEGPIVKCLLNS